VSEKDTQTQRQTEWMNKISDRLKEARSRRGWNQAQLALAAGVSPGTIGNIESNARQAKGSLPQIAKALGISHDWLANGEGEMLDNQARDRANEEPSGPSSQAALLALLFDKLPDDLVLRAQVFNKASQTIIDTIQGTEPAQTPEPAAPEPAKTQS
jgi:transcriptional regulator with XRE-family HTH domain